MNANFIKKSPEVYQANESITSIGSREIDFLCREVALSSRGRVRINLHSDSKDLLHEMFIAIRPDSYIRPHKHPNKSEAFHVVYGDVDIVIFDDDGNIKDVVSLSARAGQKSFYYRMSVSYFHTLIIRSDLLVVHEITNGPFAKDGTVFGGFAPNEGDELNVIIAWQNQLIDRVRGFNEL